MNSLCILFSCHLYLLLFMYINLKSILMYPVIFCQNISFIQTVPRKKVLRSMLSSGTTYYTKQRKMFLYLCAMTKETCLRRFMQVWFRRHFQVHLTMSFSIILLRVLFFLWIEKYAYCPHFIRSPRFWATRKNNQNSTY